MMDEFKAIMNATQYFAIHSAHHIHSKVHAGRSSPGAHTSDATRGSNIGKLDTVICQLYKLISRLAKASENSTIEATVVCRDLTLSVMAHN